jgi:ribonuclease Z
VIFTGTGSMIPSTYRNVSGVVIELEGLSVMCDCGEGTMNQLANSLKSVSEFISCLKRIKVIWLSHIHCDHTLGTTIFIKRREEYLRQLN